MLRNSAPRTRGDGGVTVWTFHLPDNSAHSGMPLVHYIGFIEGISGNSRFTIWGPGLVKTVALGVTFPLTSPYMCPPAPNSSATYPWSHLLQEQDCNWLAGSACVFLTIPSSLTDGCLIPTGCSAWEYLLTLCVPSVPRHTSVTAPEHSVTFIKCLSPLTE